MVKCKGCDADIDEGGNGFCGLACAIASGYHPHPLVAAAHVRMEELRNDPASYIFRLAQVKKDDSVLSSEIIE